MHRKLLGFLGMLVVAAAPIQCVGADAGQPALTIFNQNFAVVRQTLALDLRPGVNQVRFAGATLHLEPDSVILRDLSGRRLQVLEQNYRNDPVSQGLLLSLYEGQVLDFMVQRYYPEAKTEIIQGRVIRSGYLLGGGMQEPIIEVNGKLQFSLPGLPIFPALTDSTILQPTLDWLLETDRAGATTGELSYVTGGVSWEADYNLVTPTQGDVVDLIGWVTINNQTGKSWENARIKLMAGDVHKLQNLTVAGRAAATKEAAYDMAMASPVSEKSFDEFHLYTLERATTLHDRETKQVEFVHAQGVKAQRIYVYDGLDRGYYGGLNQDPGYGTNNQPKVWVMQEFKNDRQNGLGMPLPKGRVRFYRRDDDGQLEFVGENQIDHTPADETVRLYTGNAFDLVGERKRADFKVDSHARWMDESFEIKLRNHKKEAAEFRVVEHLYRWSNWQITASNYKPKKTDAQTAEFRVSVPPDGERVLTYTVHYTW